MSKFFFVSSEHEIGIFLLENVLDFALRLKHENGKFQVCNKKCRKISGMSVNICFHKFRLSPISFRFGILDPMLASVPKVNVLTLTYK